ncbi:MAG: hypothetical protein L6246_01840 [Thermodesulfovibrionales bacterium]|nr:hypothetical protein [Nitrospinota bacterium]MCG2709049.1 hypothetical protein [Thermodesulfovibrionales bacterium]
MKDAVWLVSPDTKELVTPYEEQPKCKRLVAAQPFTVSMVAAVVAEDLDGIFRGKNDILVLSRTSMGEQPLVERIHFFEEEVPKGHPIKHMLAENLFIADDYNGIDKLWLEIDVLEIDTNTGERKAAVKAFQSLAATAGAVFPAILPYAFGASVAVGVVAKMVEALEKDTHVVRVPFAMYPDAPRLGRAPLQSGTYIAFAKPQDPSGFKFQANGLLTASNETSEVSYVVFDVAPVKQVSPKFVTNQKVATLLTQMQRDNPHSALATIDFLTDTLTQYENFKKLNRYLELKSKGQVSDEEKTLLAEIEKMDVLKPFLPKK